MRFRLLLSVVSCAVVFTAAGCVSKPRFYAVDRPRVDQANTGNSGYIGGDKKEGDSIDGRSTRRIYVFEFDRKKKLEAEKAAQAAQAAESATITTTTIAAPAAEPAKQQGITIPYIGDDEKAGQIAATDLSVSGMQYTVMKDDTLQKISKKVYGSHGKWTKIYDANKDKIKNPNFVKPGTVITIPPLE
ncbi:MAG: LysM peptidoglycan-binding domain-containing protein [Candidatus Omnitrophica bacterium]|nr:LysM peptidoglycan-binding domain-containing protein [Candidatus Omnitrophota bacterium]